MSDKGFVAMDRDIFHHPLLRGKKRCDLAAWAWLFSEAAWKPRRVVRGGHFFEIERGQVAHSLGFMAREWKWSVKQVRSFLKRWVREGAIHVGTKKGTTGGKVLTVVTICNYDIYQKEGHDKGTIEGTTGAQQGQQPNKGTIEPLERDEIGGQAESVSQPDFKKHAWELNVKLWIIMGIDPGFPDPGWCGLAHALEAGLRSNKWDPEICRLAAVKLAAKKKPKSFKYLLDAIHTEHQETADILKRMEASSDVQPNQREFALLTPIRGGGRQKGPGFASLAAEALRTAANDRRDG